MAIEQHIKNGQDGSLNRPMYWGELGAVVGTGVLHPLFKYFDAKGLFILSASIFWIAYMARQVWRDPDVWEHWGFRTQNLGKAFVWPSLFFVLSGLAMAAFGMANGRRLWQANMLFLVLLYPLWGILQQFLVQALGVGNLLKLFPQAGLWLAMPAGMILFSLVHYPNIWVMTATAGLACVCIPCYLRDRNLWPLGLLHGWLGTLFYLWVLGRDPWAAVFGK